MSASCDISSFLRGLGEARRRALATAEKRLKQFAHHVIGDSQSLCPRKTGRLIDEGKVGEFTSSGSAMTVEIGHNTDYAAAVHERLDLKHSQGQAKFLETALRRNQPKMAAFMAQGVKQGLG